MPRALTLAPAAVAIVAAVGAAGPAESPPGGPTAVLRRIDEIRRTELVRTDDGLTFGQPGLVLGFGLQVPEGRRVVDVREHPGPTSADSTGRDLSAREPDAFGRVEHVQLVQTWGEDPSEFRFTLALPSRRATAFALDATIDVTTDAGSRDATVRVGAEWTDLDPQLFGEPVRARLQPGRELRLEMTPGTVKAAVEACALVGDGDPIESNSAMWNDTSVTYYFDARSSRNHRVRLTLRTDLRTTPVRIRLQDQPLP